MILFQGSIVFDSLPFSIEMSCHFPLNARETILFSRAYAEWARNVRGSEANVREKTSPKHTKHEAVSDKFASIVNQNVTI